MADAPYLVALALFEQNGRRALPLAGRSQAQAAPEGETPTALAHTLALELLLRIWQRSDDGPLQRVVVPEALLVVELPMERLPEDLPQIKADWLNSGDSAAFLAALQTMGLRAWRLSIEKFRPVALTPVW